MAKIETLTAEQEAQFGRHVREWTEIGLSTKPADRPRAEAAVRRMYEIAGLPPPRIVWCGSPLSMALTRAVLLKMPQGDSVGASVGASVWASVGASVRASVWASVGDSVRASVGASVWASVWASVRASVGASVWDSVWASVGDSVRASVGASVWASVWASVRASVGASVWDSVRASVGDSVGASVWASVGDSVGASVWASVRASVGASVWDSVYGQHDASWLAFYRYFHDILGLREQTQRLDGLWEFSQSAGWAIPCREVCFVAERHNVLHRDERGRLHSQAGPALSYPDGWSIYAVHGVRVPADIIEHPALISLDRIHAEPNSEVRRVMIERFGWDRYAHECGAEILDHDERWGTLKRRRAGDEDVVFLEVVNGSAEPDGSFRRYVLPVAPQCEPLPDPEEPNGRLGAPQRLTALNAVASTYGLTGKEYSKLAVRT